MGNTGSDIGKGLLSLVGAGEYIKSDTISTLNNSLTDVKDEQNKFIQQANLSLFKGEIKDMNDIVTWSQSNNQLLADTEKMQYTILNGKFEIQTTFVILLFILIIIIVFYLLFK